jgi:DNA-binding transcriptional LysR family regulator
MRDIGALSFLLGSHLGCPMQVKCAFRQAVGALKCGKHFLILWKARLDRLAAMKVLIEVVDAGSMSAAGRRLRMPLATVSRRVSELERRLRTQIFTRSNQRLALTDGGRGYVDACRRILEDVAEAERTAAGEYKAPSGGLTVAAPVVFGRLHVLPLLTDFLEAYPNVDVHLELSDRLVDLAEEHIDVAVRIGVMPDSRLMATKIGETRQMVCAAPSYLAKRGEPRRLEELAVHDCVTFERLNGAGSWTFATKKSVTRASLRSRLVVSSAEAAVDAAIAGVGITRVLSYQIADALRAGQLKRILSMFEPAPLPISVVYPSAGRLPMKLRAFLDFIAPCLRARAHHP